MVEIIKRKRGNREYFYLEHAIRKGKKIVKKQKYLGVKVPKDIDEIKKKFEKELKAELYDKLEKIKLGFRKEWSALPRSAKERELQEIAIAFTYNTNAIEGSIINLEETRGILNEQIAPNKPLRDIKETEAHAKVFLEVLEKKDKISEALLLDWHKRMFGQTKQDIAGKYRECLVRVSSYLASDWQDIKKLMKELVVFIEKNKKMNPVELSARVHYRFEKVHPFDDGNGRIGRLLMNQILWQSKYPILIIEHKKRKSYYKALQKGEERFCSYFFRRFLTAHGERFA